MPEEDENFAKAEFLSDRTCCVCRIPGKGFQIHHIDEDNTNQDIENLAVLCLECHSQTQKKGGFVRRLSPDVVRRFNESWRKIVRAKLLPNGDLNTFSEYRAEVYLEISLTCHSWKNHYMILYPGNFMEKDTSEYLDIWDRMEKTGKHTYSELEWRRYLPLFDKAIETLVDKFQNIIMMYSDAIVPEFKTLLMRTMRQLETENIAYLASPNILASLQKKDQFFKGRFLGVISVLSHLSRKADEMIISHESDTDTSNQ